MRRIEGAAYCSVLSHCIRCACQYFTRRVRSRSKAEGQELDPYTIGRIRAVTMDRVSQRLPSRQVTNPQSTHPDSDGFRADRSRQSAMTTTRAIKTLYALHPIHPRRPDKQCSNHQSPRTGSHQMGKGASQPYRSYHHPHSLRSFEQRRLRCATGRGSPPGAGVGAGFQPFPRSPPRPRARSRVLG